MIAGWDRYSDPIKDVSRPIQMGPLWRQAQQVSGMPIDDQIWVEDPSSSSYPACLACKVAEQQSADAAERYLRCLREAVMCERRNIAREDVLLAVADELAASALDVFDAAQFRADLDSPAALEAFQEDLKETRYREIGRFPTLTLHRGGAPGIILVGYRPYDVLRAALLRVVPDLQPLHPAPDPESYAILWGSITPREIAEVTQAEGAGRGGE